MHVHQISGGCFGSLGASPGEAPAGVIRVWGRDVPCRQAGARCWLRRQDQAGTNLENVVGECRRFGISAKGMSSSHSQEEYTVRLGDKLLHFRSETTPVVPVQDIVCHRFYEETLRCDAALGLLASSVNYSSNIQPVCLPERACHVESGTEHWVTGWSRVAGGGTGRWGAEGQAGGLALARRLFHKGQGG